MKRRLYDITNVLLSLGLVSKVSITFGVGLGSHKKPGFQWNNIENGQNTEKVENLVDELKITSPKVRRQSISVLDESTNISQIKIFFQAENQSLPQNRDENRNHAGCQTSPSLLRSLIKDISMELDNSKRSIVDL